MIATGDSLSVATCSYIKHPVKPFQENGAIHDFLGTTTRMSIYYLLEVVEEFDSNEVWFMGSD